MARERMTTPDGYPTEAALKSVVDFKGTPRALTELVGSLWWPQDGDPTYKPHLTHDFNDLVDEWEWRVSTWGWSGNEDIIGVLQKTVFWWMFWQQSNRGGHYVFRIPERRFDEPGDYGWVGKEFE